jgi:uncharacterized protein YutE (UPF0331/DUF86 family)
MADDVIINKAASLERCVKRIREVHAGDDKNLYENLTSQESILLNLQRACEVSIDLAMHVIRKRRLGVPQDSREAFELLQANGLLDREPADLLKRMVGFRNVAVHEYASVNLDIVRSIVTRHLDEFLTFSQRLLRLEA